MRSDSGAKRKPTVNDPLFLVLIYKGLPGSERGEVKILLSLVTKSVLKHGLELKALPEVPQPFWIKILPSSILCILLVQAQFHRLIW